MKKFILAFTLIATTSLTVTFTGCNKDGGSGFNIFSVNDDITLGQQMEAEIAANPSTYPLLNPNTYSAAYNYLYEIRDEILNSGKVKYKNEFAWKLYIVKDDNVQNAFCTPGGYIYVYTGLIKYLDSRSALAGVIGHEMAHADRRHSTNQLTKQYSLQTLLDIVLGNNQGALSNIAANLAVLKFSRSDESEADEYSVNYLCPTKYHAEGAAYFFEKIISDGGSSSLEFLSTHPSPDNRVSNIKSHANELGCSSTISTQEDINGYAQFKASI